MSDNEIREEEFATVEIRTNASPVHGILKNKKGSNPPSTQKSGKKARHIYWDEKNLEECEAGKDSTMKITEPKTPYNRDYNSDEDKEDESDSEREHRDISTAQDAITQALLKISEDRENGVESDEEEEPPKSEEEKKREHELFEKKRKMHYNEFLEVKKFRERMAQGFVDDDDDEDDDEDNDPPPPYSE